jgi:DNA-binding transcriptional LysR family regulator
MDIRNMRQLLAVHRHGSFAKAARALGMSQPSLSTAMARLEDQLKVKLFDRTSAGSRLTPIGELIAERAGKVVADAEQIIHDAELVAGGEAGSVRLGIGTALRQSFLPRLVVTLAHHHPALSLQLELLDRDRLLPLVRSRELDLVICAFGDDVAGDDLVATEVFTTHAVAVAHPDHPLVGAGSVSIDRFCEFPAAGAALKQFANVQLLDPSRGKRALSQYQSNDYEPLLEVALSGYATLIAPMFVVRPHLDSGRLKLIDLDWRFKVSFAAIAARATTYSPIINRIIGHAAAIGRALDESQSTEVAAAG